MSRPPADELGRNFFHAIAASGELKLATRTLASTSRRIVVGGLTAKDKRGRTPLHLAAYLGHLRVLRVFADAVPEAMNSRDQDGNTVREALRRPNASVIGDPENTRYFHRMVAIDKLGYSFNEFPFGPADVWDLGMSNTSTAVIVEPTWGNGDRMLCVSTKGVMKPVDLGPGNVPRYIANSNVHTLVLTEDQCFAWGKNSNGTLGFDSDGKTVHTPEPLSENFVEQSRTFEKNLFSALGGSTKSEIKDPFVGVACCDFHSACSSTSKVWAWGANRGQMVGKVLKNTIVETPMVVFESTTRIRSIACTDNALVVLLSNGHVMLLHNDKVTRLVLNKGAADGDAVAARGQFVVVQTSQGKLLRFPLKNVDEPTTIWTSRRRKDAVLSFDVSENGAVVVATKSGVYKLEDGREVSEIKDVKGMQFTIIKTDSQFRSFVGVQRAVAGLGYLNTAAPVQERYSGVRSVVRWGAEEEATLGGEVPLHVGESTLRAHKCLLYARCPSLRPLFDHSGDMIATPGGSAIFRSEHSGLRVAHVPAKSVEVFVKSLFYAFSSTDELNFLEQDLEKGPELHEYLALRRLATKDLGEGLWEARLAGIGCDVQVHENSFAHSQILSSASPVLSSHLQRWNADGLFVNVPAHIMEHVLRFAYTMDLSAALVLGETESSKLNQVQHLFELWQVADELLMSCLSAACERRLFEMLDYDLVGALLYVTSGPPTMPVTKLRSSLLDIVSRSLDFFWPSYRDFDNDTMDSLERVVKALEETEEVDDLLVESFEALKLQALSLQPQSANKKKNGAAGAAGTAGKAPQNLLSPGQSPQSAASEPVVTKVLRPAAKAVSPLPAKASTSAIAEKSDQVVSPLPRNDGGWIQARRKSRTSSQATQERSGAFGRALSSASPSTASSPGPSTPGPWMTSPLGSGAATPALPTLNSRGRTTSPASVGPKPGPSVKPSVGLPELPQLGRPTAKPNASKLGALPSLPALGSQPAQPGGSASRGGSRPKFSQKDRKKLQQFEDPLALAQQLEHQNSANASPWKQVTVASSQSVLERLERVHQINNKRTSNGSVWGL